MSQPQPAHTFLLEAEELLAQIEATALEVRPGEPPGERLHQLFRAFHTIKGSGAMFGFDAVARFTPSCRKPCWTRCVKELSQSRFS